jgi:hypothetical protein
MGCDGIFRRLSVTLWMKRAGRDNGACGSPGCDLRKVCLWAGIGTMRRDIQPSPVSEQDLLWATNTCGGKAYVVGWCDESVVNQRDAEAPKFVMVVSEGSCPRCGLRPRRFVYGEQGSCHDAVFERWRVVCFDTSMNNDCAPSRVVWIMRV